MATRKPKVTETVETAALTAEAPVSKPRRTTAARATSTGDEAPKRTRKPKAVPFETAASPVSLLSPEERYRRIAEAAYYIAERRGFAPGDHNADWLQAEAQIDALQD